MKVFLDTNVLVSAVITRGLCRDLLTTVLEEHHAVVSKLVLDEFVRVLRDKLGATQPSLEKALMLLDDVEVISNPMVAPDTGSFAANDATILAAAVEAQADLFVTGDQALLATEGKIAIPIVSPRQFMELLSTSSDRYPEPPAEGEGPSVSDRPRTEIENAAFGFALEIIELCRSLDGRGAAWIATELLHDGTGIGAALTSGFCESPRESGRCARAALEKARITDYHLRLLEKSGIVDPTEVAPAQQQCDQLTDLLEEVKSSRW